MPLMNNAFQVSTKSQIKLSEKKIQIITIKKDRSCINKELERQRSMKILGITIRDNLKWDQHIENIVRKVPARLHLLRSVKLILSKCQLRLIYFGLVYPIQSYCSPAFLNLPTKLAKRLETTLNKAHRSSVLVIAPINVFQVQRVAENTIALQF